jgi:hypothetical protein
MILEFLTLLFDRTLVQIHVCSSTLDDERLKQSFILLGDDVQKCNQSCYDPTLIFFKTLIDIMLFYS